MTRRTDIRNELERTMEENISEESPKHGPTLSTSTSSVGGIKTYDPKLELAAKSFFTQTESYIVNEMDTINIDYRMLTQMNNLMQNNYGQILPNIVKLKKKSDDIAEKYNRLVNFSQFNFLYVLYDDIFIDKVS